MTPGLAMNIGQARPGREGGFGIQTFGGGTDLTDDEFKVIKGKPQLVGMGRHWHDRAA